MHINVGNLAKRLDNMIFVLKKIVVQRGAILCAIVDNLNILLENLKTIVNDRETQIRRIMYLVKRLKLI